MNSSRHRSHDRSPPAEGQPKRQKRGKYVSKACNQCQKRKTKCDGGHPCSACFTKGVDCVSRNPRQQTSESCSSGSHGHHEKEHPKLNLPQINSNHSRDDVMSALSQIQQQLFQIIGCDREFVYPESQPAGQVEPLNDNGPPVAQKPPQSDGLTLRGSQSRSTPNSDAGVFTGETSISHTLHEMEDNLEKMGVAYPLSSSSSPPPSQPLTPVDDQSLSCEGNYVQIALDSHGITPNRDQWDGLLKAFCEEVHILYPFLHIPLIWSPYEEMWEYLVEPSPKISSEIGQRIKLGQVLLCLATARCNESTRKGTEEGRHSAGWSLFCAGMDVLGEPLELFSHFSSSLEALQAIMLAVIYCFRIDATNKAEKFLALAVSHSHLLGLHRKKITDKLSVFQGELLRRVWWCTYILDRRLAIDTGRPFLIQDVNVDVPLPLELGESWLSEHQSTGLTPNQLKREIDLEVSRQVVTPLPHIAAMVDYSRVVGKVWEAHYGAAGQGCTSAPLTNEYLEFLVGSAVRKGSSQVWSGSKEPFHVQFSGMEWWQIKQRMLMRLRWLFLRLLIRKPSLRSPRLSHQEENTNEVVCMQLCRTIIEEFNYIPEKYPKHTFPFIHYVATATMIAVGLIIKEPNFTMFDGNFVLQAARMLKRFCTQTWVSGRIIRAVTRINQVALWALDENARSGYRPANTSTSLNRSSVAIPALKSSRSHAGLSASFQQNQPTPSPSDHAKAHSSSHGHSIPSSTSTSMLREQVPNTRLQGPDGIQPPDLNLLLPSDSGPPSASPSVLSNLVMTDFDFEETLRGNNPFDSAWASPLELLDGGIPPHSDGTFSNLISNLVPSSQAQETDPNHTAHNWSSTAAQAMLGAGHSSSLGSDLNGWNHSDWQRLIFGNGV